MTFSHLTNAFRVMIYRDSKGGARRDIIGELGSRSRKGVTQAIQISMYVGLVRGAKSAAQATSRV
jgi:hypothetical protein